MTLVCEIERVAVARFVRVASQLVDVRVPVTGSRCSYSSTHYSDGRAEVADRARRVGVYDARALARLPALRTAAVHFLSSAFARFCSPRSSERGVRFVLQVAADVEGVLEDGGAGRPLTSDDAARALAAPVVCSDYAQWFTFSGVYSPSGWEEGAEAPDIAPHAAACLISLDPDGASLLRAARGPWGGGATSAVDLRAPGALERVAADVIRADPSFSRPGGVVLLAHGVESLAQTERRPLEEVVSAVRAAAGEVAQSSPTHEVTWVAGREVLKNERFT